MNVRQAVIMKILIFYFADYSCPSLIIPEPHSLLVLDNDSYIYPPEINTSISYKCNAGGPINRRVDNYDLDSYEITCLEDNVFSTPEWPICTNSKFLVLPYKLMHFP